MKNSYQTQRTTTSSQLPEQELERKRRTAGTCTRPISNLTSSDAASSEAFNSVNLDWIAGSASTSPIARLRPELACARTNLVRFANSVLSAAKSLDVLVSTKYRKKSSFTKPGPARSTTLTTS